MYGVASQGDPATQRVGESRGRSVRFSKNQVALLIQNEPSHARPDDVVSLLDQAGYTVNLVEVRRLENLSPPDVGVVQPIRCVDATTLGALRHIRARWCRTGLIVVSNDDSTRAHAALLDAGADYALRQATLSTLLAPTVRALARRVRLAFESAEPQMSFPMSDSLAALRRMERQLYDYLCANQGRWISEVELLRNVVGEQGPTSSVVRVHICNLRKALGPSRDRIQSKRGYGYRFVLSES